MSRLRRFLIELGEYFNDPIDAFLHTFANGTWLRRILFSLALALALYWQAEWRTIGWIVAAWVAYEVLYYVVQYVARMWDAWWSSR